MRCLSLRRCASSDYCGNPCGQQRSRSGDSSRRCNTKCGGRFSTKAAAISSSYISSTLSTHSSGRWCTLQIPYHADGLGGGVFHRRSGNTCRFTRFREVHPWPGLSIHNSRRPLRLRPLSASRRERRIEPLLTPWASTLRQSGKRWSAVANRALRLTSDVWLRPTMPTDARESACCWTCRRPWLGMRRTFIRTVAGLRKRRSLMQRLWS